MLRLAIARADAEPRIVERGRHAELMKNRGI
jgi:hypothetical protein